MRRLGHNREVPASEEVAEPVKWLASELLQFLCPNEQVRVSATLRWFYWKVSVSVPLINKY